MLMLVKFSQYEFQYGDVERDKTMLESVLRNYPKRVDVWSVYIDLLIKQEDFNHVSYSYMFTLTQGPFHLQCKHPCQTGMLEYVVFRDNKKIHIQKY